MDNCPRCSALREAAEICLEHKNEMDAQLRVSGVAAAECRKRILARAAECKCERVAVPDNVAKWARKVIGGHVAYPDNSKYEEPVAAFILKLAAARKEGE